MASHRVDVAKIHLTFETATTSYERRLVCQAITTILPRHHVTAGKFLLANLQVLRRYPDSTIREIEVKLSPVIHQAWAIICEMDVAH